MAAADHSTDVRRAIIAALRASVDVQAVVGTRVFDYVPAEPVYPYIRVGQIATSIPYEDTCSIGMESQLLIHGFTSSNLVGSDAGIPVADTSSLGKPILAVLDEQDLDLDNAFTLWLRLENFQVLQDQADQAVKHCVWRFSFVTGQDR
jgi:hypothetical protein